MALSEAVLAEARANPWPFAKGHGHLHVQWKNGLDGNKQCLDAAILSESFGKRGLAWVIAGLVPTNPARVSTGQNGLP